MSAMDWKTIVGFTVIFHGLVYAWKREWVLRMDTRKFNSCINAIGQQRIRKYLRVWFRIGSYATIILGFPFTIWLFLRTIFYTIFPSIVAVAIAVTPTSLLPRVDDHSLELHHDPLSPYPDADIVSTGSGTEWESDSSTYLAIQPVLPGWNLPVSHLPYYLIAILISVVIHELGHAIASASHKVPIQSVGVSLFGPLIPAAHVELNSIQLKETPIKKQLDILTAGVWMNIYLALITYFIVPILFPTFLYPVYTSGHGLTVTAVWPGSGAGGPSGLVSGDVITGIENCPVKDLDSWYSCLEKIWEAEPLGYCVTNDTLAKFANNSEGCCGQAGDNSPTHLCFMEMDTGVQTLAANPNVSSPQETPPVDPPTQPQKVTTKNVTTYCLPAKPIVAQSTPSDSIGPEESSQSQPQPEDKVYLYEGRCNAPLYKCIPPSSPVEDFIEDPESKSSSAGTSNESHCFLPRLVKKLHRFRIVQIHRRQSEKKESVLFVGNVLDLYNGLKTTEYIPRNWLLSRLFGFSAFSKLPEKLETILLLTAGLSAGLAVVNMLPIYGLDGYHIVEAIVRTCFSKKVGGGSERKISRIVQFISWIALIIAFLTIFCSFARAI